MLHPVPSWRILRWFLPSAVAIILLLLLPEPWWPLAFVPALVGHVRNSRKEDLARPLSAGFVLTSMSPILVLSAVTLVLYLVPGWRENLPPDDVVRIVLFLGWTLSAYTLWRRSLRPKQEQT